MSNRQQPDESIGNPALSPVITAQADRANENFRIDEEKEKKKIRKG